MDTLYAFSSNVRGPLNCWISLPLSIMFGFKAYGRHFSLCVLETLLVGVVRVEGGSALGQVSWYDLSGIKTASKTAST